jgi:hypothetical protein
MNIILITGYLTHMFSQFAKLCQLFSMDDIISNLQVIEDALMDRVAQVRDAAINVVSI